MIQHINTTNGLTGINTASRMYIPTSVDTNGEDRSSVLTVFVNNGTDIIPITKNVVFSNALPIAQSIEIEYGGVKVNTDALKVPYVELSNKSLLPFGVEANRSKLLINAKDQYGVLRGANLYNFAVTGNTTGGAVSPAGFATGFSSASSGKSFQLIVFVDNLYKTIKIVVD